MTSLQNGNYNSRSMNGLTEIYANDINCDTINTIDANVSRDLKVAGDTELQGKLTVLGLTDLATTQADTLAVSGNTDLSGNLWVGGKTDLSGNLWVGGATDLSGNLTVVGITDTTRLQADNLILGNATYNAAVQIKADGIMNIGDRVNDNSQSRVLNVRGTNGLISIGRYSDNQPGFELRNYDPTTGALRQDVLFLGPGSGAENWTVLFRSPGAGGDFFGFYSSRTLFDFLTPIRTNGTTTSAGLITATSGLTSNGTINSNSTMNINNIANFVAGVGGTTSTAVFKNFGDLRIDGGQANSRVVIRNRDALNNDLANCVLSMTENRFIGGEFTFRSADTTGNAYMRMTTDATAVYIEPATLGTPTTLKSLRFRTNGGSTAHLGIDATDGSVVIATNTPATGCKLTVNGKTKTTDLNVTTLGTIVKCTVGNSETIAPAAAKNRGFSVCDTAGGIKLVRNNDASAPFLELENWNAAFTTLNTRLFLGGPTPTDERFIVRLGTTTTFDALEVRATGTKINTNLDVSGNITATGTFTGTANNANNILITQDNTNTTCYIPFVKSSGTGQRPLFIDDTTGPLTFNPSTGRVRTQILDSSETYTNYIKTPSIEAEKVTFYDGEAMRSYSQQSVNDIDIANYMSGQKATKPIKITTYDYSIANNTATLYAPNILVFGLVRLTKGVTYTGVYFQTGTLSINCKVVLYRSGLNPTVLAQRTTNYTTTAVGFQFVPFDAPYTPTTTTDQFKYAYIGFVSASNVSMYTMNNNNTNLFSSPTPNRFDLVSFSIPHTYANAFPSPYVGTPTALNLKYHLGLY